MLYNSKSKTNSILSTDTTLTAIIYYLNTNAMQKQLKNVADIISKYIVNYDEDILNRSDIEAYMELGKEIGQTVGVKLCRNITQSAMNDFVMNGGKFLYKQNEITPRYVGMYVSEQEYQWALPETTMNMIRINNPTSYYNLVAMYGEPYKNVTKFCVYNFLDENTPEIGKYDDISNAKEKLNVEE